MPGAGVATVTLWLLDAGMQILEKNVLLEKILTRWQSPEVVREILADTSRLRLGGVRSTVTVLFATCPASPRSRRRVRPRR